jgi:hypothetical protein
VSDLERDLIMEVISEHAIDFQGVPPGYDGDAVAYIADRILALLSAPEPAERTEIEAQNMVVEAIDEFVTPRIAHLILRAAGHKGLFTGGAPTAAEPEEVQKDDEGRPYPCGAFVSNDSRWFCRLASDHDGDHEWVQPFAGKPAYTSTGERIRDALATPEAEGGST